MHGDYRIDNAIFDPLDPAAIRAVVDWEMATLGDPLADLGLHLAYRDPAFAPVLGGSAASTSDHVPGRPPSPSATPRPTGRDLTDLAFYLALGYFKIAVIAEGIHARFLHGRPEDQVRPRRRRGRPAGRGRNSRTTAPISGSRPVSNVLDLFRLDGKVAVVTGASSGLGAGFAQAFAQAGADLVLGRAENRSARRGREAGPGVGPARDHGPRRRQRPRAVRCDRRSCDARIRAIDILINNAGVGTAVPATRNSQNNFAA